MKTKNVLLNGCLLPQKLNKLPTSQLRMAIADKRHIVENKTLARHESSGPFESSVD